MKINGKKIEGPNVEILVIPRSDGREDIVFQAQAVLEYDDFEKLCPEPEPPKIMLRGGETQLNVEDPRYKDAMNDYRTKRMSWMVIRSLDATEGLEWEIVKKDDPNSWPKVDDELRAAGFSQIEIGRIRQAVWAANCLDDSKLDQARQSFFHSQRQRAALLLSQREEQNGTPSGGLANVSASSHQEFEESGTTATSGLKP